MPKDQSREKKARHYTCSKCLKPAKWLVVYWGVVPQTIEFSTSDELDKHLQTEHKSAMYNCNAVGCFKEESAPKFQKAETLTQHIKESHEPGVMFSCPVKTCAIEPSKLDDVAIHVHWAHSEQPSEPSHSHKTLLKRDCMEAIALINAATWRYFRCPIWNCRKFVSGGHKKVSAHLLAHLPIELEDVRDELARDGYQIDSVPDSLPLRPDTLRTSSVQIKCPACEVRCENDAEFRRHLEASHMIARSPGVLEHFRTWREDVTSCSTERDIKKLSSLPCWLEGDERYMVKISCRVKCSYSTCSFSLEEREETHPTFLRPANEVTIDLWLHRIKILRHYPDFITHPMFQEQYPELEVL
jgi:hypothetical protein